MESNLNKVFISYISYKDELRKKIKSVCKKIGFRDKDIQWVIFDPRLKKITNPIEKVFIGSKGRDYGFCYPKKKVIYISTLAIQKNINDNIIYKNKITINKNKPDFLADVILDEIAHIVTKCDHGNPIYDSKLNQFKQKYYRNTFSIL